MSMNDYWAPYRDREGRSYREEDVYPIRAWLTEKVVGLDFAAAAEAMEEMAVVTAKMADEMNGVWVLVPKNEAALAAASAADEAEAWLRRPRRRDDD